MVWSNEWGRKIYFSHGLSNSRGVAMLVSKGLNIEIEGFWNDREGRFLAIAACIEQENILLVNVYAPNEDDPGFFNRVFQFLEQNNHEFEEIIMGGDWNTTMNFIQDKKGAHDNHVKKRGIIMQYMEHFSLVDIWRDLHPNIFQFTFQRLEPKPVFSRLDYFLISQGLTPSVLRAEIIPKFLSDHGMVILDLKLEEGIRGPGYWKFNNLHLQDADFVNRLNLAIDEYGVQVLESQVVHTPDVYWEGLKARMVAEAVDFSIKKAKGKRNLIDLLQLKLIKLDKKLLEEGVCVDKVKKDIKKTELFIENEHEKDTVSAIFRSKSTYYQLGEKPSKYFFNLEKTKSRGKAVKMLRSEEGNILENSREILCELQKYYQ